MYEEKLNLLLSFNLFVENCHDSIMPAGGAAAASKALKNKANAAKVSVDFTSASFNLFLRTKMIRMMMMECIQLLPGMDGDRLLDKSTQEWLRYEWMFLFFTIYTLKLFQSSSSILESNQTKEYLLSYSLDINNHSVSRGLC